MGESVLSCDINGKWCEILMEMNPTYSGTFAFTLCGLKLHSMAWSWCWHQATRCNLLAKFFFYIYNLIQEMMSFHTILVRSRPKS